MAGNEWSIMADSKATPSASKFNAVGAAKRRPGRPKGSKNKPKRVDPVFRPLSQADLICHIENKDPRREYVLANIDDKLALQTYKLAGYVTEDQREGGPRMAVGDTVKDGEELTGWGHVLMSIDKKRFHEIQRKGIDGQSGLDRADRIERIIRKTKQGLQNRDGSAVTDRIFHEGRDGMRIQEMTAGEG